MIIELRLRSDRAWASYIIWENDPGVYKGSDDEPDRMYGAHIDARPTTTVITP